MHMYTHVLCVYLFTVFLPHHRPEGKLHEGRKFTVKHQCLAKCLANNSYPMNVFQINEQMWAFLIHKMGNNNPCHNGLLLGMSKTTQEEHPIFSTEQEALRLWS